jgi:hypothetical protein
MIFFSSAGRCIHRLGVESKSNYSTQLFDYFVGISEREDCSLDTKFLDALYIRNIRVGVYLLHSGSILQAGAHHQLGILLKIQVEELQMQRFQILSKQSH